MKIVFFAILALASLCHEKDPNITYNKPFPTVASGFANLIVSSEWDANYSPSHARLDYVSRVGAGSWSAGFLDQNQFIILNFGLRPVKVTSIVTQGRADFDQWVTSYKVQYSQDGIYYSDVENGKIYPANGDRNNKVTNYLNQNVFARLIKIIPVTYYGHISLRLEVYVNDNPV